MITGGGPNTGGLSKEGSTFLGLSKQLKSEYSSFVFRIVYLKSRKLKHRHIKKVFARNWSSDTAGFFYNNIQGQHSFFLFLSMCVCVLCFWAQTVRSSLHTLPNN